MWVDLLPRFKPYAQLMRWDKPIGTYLCLWPTIWALWFAAEGLPPLYLIVIMVLGAFIMRSAGCIINDVFDVKFDAQVERTRDRPLASGVLSRQSALYLFAVLIFLAFLLVLQLNHLSILVAMAVLLGTVLYPLSKRITFWPQMVLGLVFNGGVLVSYAAVTNSLPLQMWLLYAACIVWTFAYDTVYALMDRPDDIKVGIKSSARRLGSHALLAVAIADGLFLSGLLVLGIWKNVSMFFYIGWAIAGYLLYRQCNLAKSLNTVDLLRAFKLNHYVGLAIGLGLFINI